MPVIREKRQYDSVRPVGVVRMDTGETKKYLGIASATQKLTNMAVAEMGRQAEISAEQSAQEVAATRITTINPKTGKPEALDWIGDNRFIGRKAASAYARVISDRFQKEIDDQIKQRAGEIALQYENDPYSVEKYEDQMVSFLEGMAQGSEENGKKTAYTNYILDQGTQYITSTKLSMMQERQRRERNKLQASIVAKNAENLEMAFNFGLEGRDASDFIEASVDRNLDGEASALLKPGASIAHSNALETAYVNGSINRIFQGLNGKPADRARVELAIRTKNTDGLPEKLAEQIEGLLPYIDQQNRTSILQQASALSSDFAAIEIQQAKLQTELNKIKARELRAYYDSDEAGYEAGVRSSIIDAYNSMDSGEVSAAIQTASDEAAQRIETLTQQMISKQLTKEEANRFIDETRTATLTPILITAAREGNVDELRRSILTGYASDKLTSYQRQVVDMLQQDTPFFDINEDRTFVQTFLNQINDPEQDALNSYIRSINLDTDITSVIADAQQGSIDFTRINELRSQIVASSDLSDAQKDSQLLRINTGLAVGQINGAAGANAAGMNALGIYIRSSGREDVGLPTNLKAVADNVLALTDDRNRSKVLAEINTREADLRSNEAAEKAANDVAAKEIKLLKEVMHGGTKKTVEHRRAADRRLASMGIEDVTMANSESKEFYALARNTIPESLKMGLETLATGASSYTEEQANVLLNHFVRLSSDPTVEGGGFVNRFSDLLGGDFAVLKEAAAIRTQATGSTKPITEIMADLKNRTQTSGAMQNYEEVFGSRQKNAAYNFIMEVYDDQALAEEMAPIASYYAKTGRTEKAIKSLLEDIVQTNYLESEYIVDPARPAGSIKSSRYSLGITFPTEEERTEFLKIVQSELPEGYNIIGTARPRGQEVISPRYIPSEDKRVYLVPYGATQEPQYYTYYVDETEELRPLIIEKDGKDFWPMFDASTTSDWQEAQEAKRAEESKSIVEQRRGFVGSTFQKLGEAALFGGGTGIGRMR